MVSHKITMRRTMTHRLLILRRSTHPQDQNDKCLFKMRDGIECLHYNSIHSCTVVYCTVLYCAALYCTVLYCTVLHYTVLYCAILRFTVLYCPVLQSSRLLSAALLIPTLLIISSSISIRALQ